MIMITFQVATLFNPYFTYTTTFNYKVLITFNYKVYPYKQKQTVKNSII